MTGYDMEATWWERHMVTVFVLLMVLAAAYGGVRMVGGLSERITVALETAVVKGGR